MRYVLYILFLIASFAAGAQEVVPPDLSFDNYNSDSKFINQFANSVYKDKTGYIWICANGLYRFDGRNYMHYTNNGHGRNGLRDDYTAGAVEDSHHRLWISAIGGLGYYDYSADKFVYLDIDSTHQITYAYAFFMKGNELWFVCNFGLCHLDLTTLRIKTTSLGNVQDPIVICEAGSDTLLLSVNDGTYYLYDLKSDNYTNNTFFSKRHLRIVSMIKSNGQYFIGTQRGLWHFNASSPPRPIKNTARFNITSAAVTGNVTGDSIVWLGTEHSGLIAFNSHTDAVVGRFTHNAYETNSIPSNYVTDLYSAGNELWIGCERGISCVNFRNQTLKTVSITDQSNDAGNNVIRCMVQDRFDSNIVWGGAEKLYKINWRTKRVLEKHEISALAHWIPRSVGITDIIQLNDHELLLNLQVGLAVWNTAARTLKTLIPRSKIPEHALINRIFKDHFGTLFIAATSGLYEYVPALRQLRPLWADAAALRHSSYNIIDGLADSAGIWGATRAGLLRYDRLTHKATIYKVHVKGYAYPDYLASIAADNDGIIWCAGRSGLLRFDPTTRHFEFFEELGGMKNLICNTIAVVKNIVWLNTNAGLISFNRGDHTSNVFPVQAARAISVAPFSHIYDELVITFRNSFCYFRPGAVSRQPLPSVPEIEMVRVNNNKLYSGAGSKELTMNYRENTLSFTYTAFEYNNPLQIQFRYKINELDNGWQYTDERTVNYISIPPGRYTFILESGDGINWNPHARVLRFAITPPFWQTLWFRCITGLAIFFAAYLLFRYRLRHTLELEGIRTKIAADFHDDLGSTLSSISIFSEVARKNADGDIDRTKSLLVDIGEKTRYIITAMNEMIWAVKPENDNLHTLIQYMQDLGRPLAEAKDMELSVTVQGDLREMSIGMTLRKNLYSIFKEALNNALKYSGATCISVHIGRVRNQLSLVIKDNGRGINSDTVKRGNGITNMERRAREIGGHMTLTSKEGEGTEILVVFKIA